MDLTKALLDKDFANLKRYHMKVAPVGLLRAIACVVKVWMIEAIAL
jgi:hypothetical protein